MSELATSQVDSNVVSSGRRIEEHEVCESDIIITDRAATLHLGTCRSRQGDTIRVLEDSVHEARTIKTSTSCSAVSITRSLPAIDFRQQSRSLLENGRLVETRFCFRHDSVRRLNPDGTDVG